MAKFNKIGCVIAYRKGHTNYGTSLVGYALIKKLQTFGYNVEVINYIKQLSFQRKLHGSSMQYDVTALVL